MTFERQMCMEDSIPDRPADDDVPGGVEDEIPAEHRHLPPGIGEVKFEPERRSTMAWLTSKPWAKRLRWLLLPVPIVIAVGLYYLTSWHPPSQQQAQQDVATLVGQADNTTVTAKCTVPDKSGYSCSLRDAAGRYGYSITLFSPDKEHSDRYVTRTISDTSFAFPINADGAGSMTLDASPPGDLSLGITATLDAISSSLGDPDLLALYGRIDCGDQNALTTVDTPCTVQSPILSARIKSVGDDRFQLSYTVKLPGS